LPEELSERSLTNHSETWPMTAEHLVKLDNEMT